MAEDEFTLPSQILTRRLQYLTVSYVEMSVESTPQIPGMGGGAGIGNWPSHTPNTPTTPVFQLGMSSLQLAGPPHSTHPGLSSHPNYGYHDPSRVPQDLAYTYAQLRMSQIPSPSHPGHGASGPHTAPLSLTPRSPSNQFYPGQVAPVPLGLLPPASSSRIHSYPSSDDGSLLPPTPSTTAYQKGASVARIETVKAKGKKSKKSKKARKAEEQRRAAEEKKRKEEEQKKAEEEENPEEVTNPKLGFSPSPGRVEHRYDLRSKGVYTEKPGAPHEFTMGNFSAPTSEMTNKEKSAMSQRSTSNTVTRSGVLFGRLSQMTPTSSQSGPSNDRTGGGWGGERNQSSKVRAVDVEREVIALLDKLAMDEFDHISDQIIEWANKSEGERDARTLIHVARLVFEKAINDAARSEVYARLCKKMIEMISPGVQDDGIRSSDGKLVVGGQIFQKYLLSRCQEDFERGWTVKGAGTFGEVEHYAAQKAKQRGLGLIQFICELYKLQMLAEIIMHECIKKLLSNIDDPEEEEIESLCLLLTTVGKLLDNPKARAHMDIYFTRMRKLEKSSDVAPRIQFMIRDLIELRARKWVPRNQVTGPTTVAQVREEVAKLRAQVEKETANHLAMSRGGFRRSGDHGGEPPADEWSIGSGSTPRSPPKTGDPSNLGRINKSGPDSVLADKRDGTKHDSTLARVNQNSNTNMFTMLSRDAEAMPETGSRPSQLSSRKTKVDLGAGSTPEPQRKKLQPLPQPKFAEEESESQSGCKPRHSEFYFGSGNVVFVCQDTSFRVQSDLLSKNSQVFRGMLKPARLDGEHLSDGCPCIHLPDGAEDFATLLRVFYTSGFPHRHKTPDFTTFSSLLRMTTKYQFREIRSQILLDLLPAYPTKLSEYEGSSCLGEAVFGSPIPHPSSVLDLFVTCNVAFALPFAYYRACVAGDPASLDTGTGGTALLPDTLRTVLRGQARLEADEVRLVKEVALKDCTSWGRCLRKSPAGRVLIFDWIHPETATQSGILEREDSLGSEYCSRCLQAFQQELSKTKKDTWENLPSYFGLPPWDETVN